MGNDCRMGARGVFGMREMFSSWIVVLAAQLCKFTRSHWIVHLKWVNFMVSNFI